MLHLGPLAFSAPWMLLGLLALPAIWWLVRISPPIPKRVRFPATRILIDIAGEEETPAHTPLWLLLLRLVIIALVIVALARPVWNPAEQIAGSGPMLIVLDDGWTSATHWRERQNALTGLLNEAQRSDQLVLIARTTPAVQPQNFSMAPAHDIRQETQNLQPQPLLPRRLAVLEKLRAMDILPAEGMQTIWLSDGLDHGEGAQFAEALRGVAKGKGLRLLEPAPDKRAIALLPPSSEGNDFVAKLLRVATDAPFAGTVRGLGRDGEPVGEAGFYFNEGAGEAEARFDLPLELKNRIARIDIAGERAAGSVSLIDERWRRRTVGLVASTSAESAQPLLSELYYLDRAIAPYAEVRPLSPNRGEKSEIEDLLSSPLSVLVLADIGTLVPADHERLTKWVEEGGVLVRFAGPRLAAQEAADDLLPITLRTGGRSLGGALSWTNPQYLAPFDAGSPFYGLDLPGDVTVTRQVLADPTPELVERSWARLEDGTPLVTAANRGKGRVVLFHITANTDWSNLAMSGLYVDMLRRIIALSQSVATNNDAAQLAGGMLAPVRVLDGFGALVPPPPTAAPIPLKGFDALRPDPHHPPGFYGAADNPHAFNPTSATMRIQALGASPAIDTRQFYTQTSERLLAPWAVALALLLAAADGLAALYMLGLFDAQPIRRRLNRRFGRRTALLLVGALALAQAHVPDLAAAESFALQATRDTRLAYVITGDRTIDEVSKSGLDGLTLMLRQRTAMEAGMAMGVDMERDELAFFPVLYWPMTQSQPALSSRALAKIDTYLKGGGLILFDTRDQQSTGTGTQNLRRLLGGLDLPALEPVPQDHVLTKSFYLLNDFPGRWTGGKVWVETTGTSQANDGVSAIIVGANDYAAAWARDPTGRPLFSVTPGGEMQREISVRFGINLVMYALTGNYKADQVHVPALLERLGQ